MYVFKCCHKMIRTRDPYYDWAQKTGRGTANDGWEMLPSCLACYRKAEDAKKKKNAAAEKRKAEARRRYQEQQDARRRRMEEEGVVEGQCRGRKRDGSRCKVRAEFSYESADPLKEGKWCCANHVSQEHNPPKWRHSRTSSDGWEQF